MAASSTRSVVVRSMANLFTPQFYSFTRAESDRFVLNSRLYNGALGGLLSMLSCLGIELFLESHYIDIPPHWMCHVDVAGLSATLRLSLTAAINRQTFPLKYTQPGSASRKFLSPKLLFSL